GRKINPVFTGEVNSLSSGDCFEIIAIDSITGTPAITEFIKIIESAYKVLALGKSDCIGGQFFEAEKAVMLPDT
ncbi:MAG: hypothetical protein R3312_10215, partial [Gammaproteobacteria bacterium]|nr:hypothetical protein [Gammaproteobacteria bacterium]